MKKIECVCFPRSGHHVLANVLFKYFSGNIDFMEFYGDQTRVLCNKVISAGDFYYCACDAHCNNFPCIDKRTNFQKHHDYNLELGMKDGFKYILMYRDPLETLVSLYNYHLKKPYDYFFGEKVEDTSEGWEFFAKLAIEYWKGFIDKWIFEKNINDGDVLFIDYTEIIGRPFSTFFNIIRFIAPDEKVDTKLLREAIIKMNISRKSDVRKFKYYNKSFFDEIRDKVSRELLIFESGV